MSSFLYFSHWKQYTVRNTIVKISDPFHKKISTIKGCKMSQHFLSLSVAISKIWERNSFIYYTYRINSTHSSFFLQIELTQIKVSICFNFWIIRNRITPDNYGKNRYQCDQKKFIFGKYTPIRNNVIENRK